MSVANVYEKLQNAIAECEQGAANTDVEKNRLRGMSQGFQLALRVLADEKVFPEENSKHPIRDNNIIPFPSN